MLNVLIILGCLVLGGILIWMLVKVIETFM